MDDLDRHRATEHSLLGSVHSPHATHTDEFEHHVRAADGATEQRVLRPDVAAMGGRSAQWAEAVRFVMRSAALMAQDHEGQDNPSIRWPKAPMLSDAKPRERTQRHDHDRDAASAPAAPGTAKRPSGAVALVLLGTNAWATSVGWTLLPADVRLRDAALAASALVWLLLGAVLHLRRSSLLPEDAAAWRAEDPVRWRAEDAARWLLLCVYPVALAAALCLGPEAARERVHSPLSVLFCSLSLLAYGVVAVSACQAPLSLLTSVTHTRKPNRTNGSRPPNRLRVALVALLCAGALAVSLIAPLLPAYATVEAAWGDAADSGAVLAAVVGGALGVSVIAIHLGALLHARTPERRDTARQRRQRVATLLFLALFGVVVYFSVVR
jgi:hypothetical protein